jgi:hypothetical protein
MSAFVLAGPRDPGKFLCVLLHGFWEDAVVNELTFAATLDQAGLHQHLEMVRDGAGAQAVLLDDFPTIDVGLSGDAFVDLQAGWVSQSFRDFRRLVGVHSLYRF